MVVTVKVIGGAMRVRNERMVWGRLELLPTAVRRLPCGEATRTRRSCDSRGSIVIEFKCKGRAEDGRCQINQMNSIRS